MANFLLIHGAAHGAWCWRDVIPHLQASGHTVRAIDMPGHGENPMPYQDVTLDKYAQSILDALTGPTIAVAHSMGGFPLTLAAERAPAQFQRLIYLCAYVPAPGLSLSQMRMQAPYQPLLPAIQMTQDKLGWTADPTMVKDIFYHDCPEGTTEYALQNLCVQATQPTSVPVETGPNYTIIPRSYIRCTQDRTIPPDYQATMTRDWPAADVYTLPTAHSPFFADPAGLAHLLNEISKQ